MQSVPVFDIRAAVRVYQIGPYVESCDVASTMASFACSGSASWVNSGALGSTLPAFACTAGAVESYAFSASCAMAPAWSCAAVGIETFAGAGLSSMFLACAASAVETFVCAAATAMVGSLSCAASASETFSLTGASAMRQLVSCAAVSTETFVCTGSSSLASLACAAVAAETFSGAVASAMAPSVTCAAAAGETFTGTVASSMMFSSAAAATNFDPSQLSGLLLFLRADRGVTIGTGVSTWADQSGAVDSNRNFTQATGSKQPTLNATDAAYNNQATLSFAKASSQAISSGTWSVTPSSPITVLFVGQTDQSSTQSICDGLATGTARVSLGCSITTVQIVCSSTINFTTALIASPCAMAGVFNAASSALYINSSSAAKVTGNPGTEAATGMRIGSSFNNGQFLNGKIAEIIVCSGALSTATIAQVFSYFATRYGIAAS